MIPRGKERRRTVEAQVLALRDIGITRFNSGRTYEVVPKRRGNIASQRGDSREIH